MAKILILTFIKEISGPYRPEALIKLKVKTKPRSPTGEDKWTLYTLKLVFAI